MDSITLECLGWLTGLMILFLAGAFHLRKTAEDTGQGRREVPNRNTSKLFVELVDARTCRPKKGTIIPKVWG